MRPNTTGKFFIPSGATNSTLNADGVFNMTKCGSNFSQMGGAGNGDVWVDFSASRSSALYQNGITEIRVNALLGMNLIRAF